MRVSTSQQDLLSRAITALDGQFDPDSALLVHPAVAKFRSVHESLCYSALLLAEQNSGSAPDPPRVARANAIIDAVLETQVRASTRKTAGAFPLAWSPDGGGAGLADAATRQTVGSMLGMLAKRFPDCLGETRVKRIEAALNLCCVGERSGRLAAAHLQMMRAWLDLEHGYYLGGERLAASIAQQPGRVLRAARFGNPEALAQQLWSVGLWFHNTKLINWAARLGLDMWQDVAAWLHPDLSTLFGAGVQADLPAHDKSPAGDQPWQQVWLSWLELTRGSDSLNLDGPLAAAMLALPVLVAQQDATGVRKALDAQPEERAIEDEVGGLQLTGWFEKNLHIETARLPEDRPGGTVVAAFWPTRKGLAQLRCKTTRGLGARCDKRFVRLQHPGVADVQISGLGAGETRMIEGGWWLAGLHLGVDGFRIKDARRTEDGLRISLQATVDEPLLFFAPLAG